MVFYIKSIVNLDNIILIFMFHISKNCLNLKKITIQGILLQSHQPSLARHRFPLKQLTHRILSACLSFRDWLKELRQRFCNGAVGMAGYQNVGIHFTCKFIKPFKISRIACCMVNGNPEITHLNDFSHFQIQFVIVSKNCNDRCNCVKLIQNLLLSDVSCMNNQIHTMK